MIFAARMRASFEKYGWLLPIWIPTAFMIGRGAGNTLFTLYLLWAIPSVWKSLRDLRGWLVYLFSALILAGFTSALLSDYTLDSIQAWTKYVLMAATLLFTIPVVMKIPDAMKIATSTAGLAGVFSMGAFIVKFIYLWPKPDFVPATMIQGLVPAYLLPFAWIWLRKHTGLIVTLIITGLFIGLLSQAESRTELLTAIVALMMLWTFVKRQWLVPLLLVVILTPVAIFNRHNVTPPSEVITGQHLMSDADQISSMRTVIWRQAIQTPPSNIWLGVGPDNVSHYPVVQVSADGKVKHLHNFIFDAWYETGAIGLILYLALYGSLTILALRFYFSDSARTLEPGIWLASFAAIYTASLLDPSYRSYPLALFMPFGLALFYVAQSVRKRK